MQTAMFDFHPPPLSPSSTPVKLPRDYNVLHKVTSNSWQFFCRVNAEDAPGQGASTEARWEPHSLPATLLHPVSLSLTPLPTICADLPPAVTSGGAGCGVPACAWQTTAQLCRCCQGDSEANICAPRGNNRAALCEGARLCDTVSKSWQTYCWTSCVGIIILLLGWRSLGNPPPLSHTVPLQHNAWTVP